MYPHPHVLFPMRLYILNGSLWLFMMILFHTSMTAWQSAWRSVCAGAMSWAWTSWRKRQSWLSGVNQTTVASRFYGRSKTTRRWEEDSGDGSINIWNDSPEQYKPVISPTLFGSWTFAPGDPPSLSGTRLRHIVPQSVSCQIFSH